MTLDKEIPMGEQRDALRGEPLFGARRRLRGRRARSAFGQFGLRGCQTLASAGHGTSDGFVHRGHDMKRTDVMRDIPKHLHEGGGIEGRAIGREAAEGQGTCRQGRCEPPEKRPDISVGGIVIQPVIEEALVAAIIDRGENAEGAIIELIGGHVA